MRIVDPGKKPLLCDGPPAYEPLVYPSGTLSDGTTYTFTATPGAVVTDLGQGTIDFGSNNDVLTVNFSAPVDARFTSAAASSTRGVWHGTGENVGTKATTNGSAWCLIEGTVPTNIQLNGQVAQSFSTTPAVRAQDPWGSLESFSTSEISIRAYVWDSYNFEARPKTKVEQPICDVLDDVCNQLKAAQYVAPAALTSAVSCGTTFENCNGRSSWWGGWSPVITANQAQSTLYDWRTVGNGIVTSPDCQTDMTVTARYGSHYIRVRRAILYLYYDYRLLINGAVVLTRTTDSYRIIDRRNDTNPDVIPPVPTEYEQYGMVVEHRDNIPASATVELQVRVRYTVGGAQTSAYVRTIQGLRSQTSFHFSPETIITEVS